MPLRGKTPEQITRRLKFYMYGEPGVGKTYAAIKMPNPYIIDTEGGTDHYGEIISSVGGAVFRNNNYKEIMQELLALATEDHPFKTLVIDPFTGLFENALEEAEDKLGAAHGRHYGEAYKKEKRLINLISQLDMNVVFTSHIKERKSKDNQGNAVVDGYTFDGGKYLNRLFDLGFELHRGKDNKRYAKVIKTRLPQFADQDIFEWSYEELAKRYGDANMSAAASKVELTDAKGAKISAAKAEAEEKQTALKTFIDNNKDKFNDQQTAWLAEITEQVGTSADEWMAITQEVQRRWSHAEKALQEANDVA